MEALGLRRKGLASPACSAQVNNLRHTSAKVDLLGALALLSSGTWRDARSVHNAPLLQKAKQDPACSSGAALQVA